MKIPTALSTILLAEIWRKYIVRVSVSTTAIRIIRSSDFSLLDKGLEVGILSVLASADYPKMDAVENPSPQELAYPPTSIVINSCMVLLFHYFTLQ